MDQTIVATPDIPDHVPAGLVSRFSLDIAPAEGIDPFRIALDGARAEPDIFYALSGRRGRGAWVVTRHQLIREVFQDPETFSSHHNADFSQLVGEDWPLLPLEADPPDHAAWRILLNPIFAPVKMRALEAEIEQLAADLVDGFAAKGEVEFVKDFGEVYPIIIFLRLFGLPLDLAAQFVAWEWDLIHGATMELRATAAANIVAYLRATIIDRRANPTGDLISYVVTTEVNGGAVSDDQAVGVCFLLYSAGLDTVANTLAFMFQYLAENPAQQLTLRDDPAKIPDAIEEMLRAFPIIVSSRLVTRDIEFHGVKMRAGDVISLPTMLAGRDDTEFPGSDTVDFNREHVSHITFAAGPHRCIGSHLARRELRIALETWLTKIPPFRIKPGAKAVTHGMGVYGVSSLPLEWAKA